MNSAPNPDVDRYLEEGCGRCHLGGTPQCKVHTWPEELSRLRKIVLDSGLNEEIKWGVPCYTFKGKNISIVSAFKDYCSISFFKGSLMKDPKKIFSSHGENSQAARIIKFTDSVRILELEQVIRSYIFEAIEVEKAGLKVDFKAKHELVYPEELLIAFEQDPALKEAFESLTPGRKRGYVLYFIQAKQSSTRFSRIERSKERILKGTGIHDR